MQPQLFLFDDDEQNREKMPADNDIIVPSPLTGDSGADEQSSTENESHETVVAVNDIAGENPFAHIQKKQQDKVDILLLTTGRKRGRKSFKEMDEEAILPEIPGDEELAKKQIIPTKVVADWFGITASQLRAWENEFEVLKPKKNGKGDRFFRPEDVKNLKLIYHLIRVRKFTVQGAKQYLADNKKKLQTTMQLTESLNKFKQFLLELKAISG